MYKESIHQGGKTEGEGGLDQAEEQEGEFLVWTIVEGGLSSPTGLLSYMNAASLVPLSHDLVLGDSHSEVALFPFWFYLPLLQIYPSCNLWHLTPQGKKCFIFSADGQSVNSVRSLCAQKLVAPHFISYPNVVEGRCQFSRIVNK